LVSANFSRTKLASAFAADKDGNNVSETAHFVTFHENGSTLTIKTDAKTVEDALSRAKIELDSNDRTEPERLEEIEVEDGKNFDVFIYRARPVIVIDGAVKKYFMTATYDTKSLAAQAGFTIYKGDKIKTKLPKNVLEAGLTETYEIIHGDSTETENRAELKTISREKILDIKEVKEEPKKVAKIPEFVTNPDRATCEAWMRAAGISESDMDVAYWIIFKESKCRYNATNRSSGAYGIPQALPGKKMASAGSDWQTNPITQIKWMISYVNGRYGGWNGAKRWWDTHHWY
jgi:hypothetical protein